jgi:hypothetical protein
MPTQFHKDLFGNSKVNRGDTKTRRQNGNRINLLSFLKNKENRLKTPNKNGGIAFMVTPPFLFASTTNRTQHYKKKPNLLGSSFQWFHT